MKKVFTFFLCCYVSITSAQQQERLVKPSDLSLGVSIRQESFVTPLGMANIRWARSAESLFGRTPERAVIDAMTTVKRVAARLTTKLVFTEPGFKWDIVIMDEKVPEKEIPQQLINNCHPAWMTPPANMYVVAQRVVSGCGGDKAQFGSGDAKLARVLIHEIGHTVEFALLQQGISDRVTAEGFASWFEYYASGYSSLLSQSTIAAEHRSVAKRLKASGQTSGQFQGTYEDYVLASLPFHAIESKRGISGIESFYKELVKSKDFYKALSSALDWSPKKLDEEITKWVG